MSYVALYRKFRPQTFEDVKGQDHIVKTFKNQINTGRLGHAYLFCGTRGTGKTSVAKIVAKAVNCENPKDGSPCGECAVCKAIAAGSSMNVIEIDAASNNGVDNIRELKEEVAYPPTEGKYKVYIIDEVHMLSTGAFNALLKTLEEPPEYVIFILATTEVHKIPITILSRCQRYDFKRITSEVIKDRLIELTQKENVDAEERALAYIAKAADGSMRDALSLLDQCIAFYLGDTLTYDHVLEVLGAVDTEVFRNIFKGALKSDAGMLLREITKVVEAGRDLSQFVSEFVWYLRNLMIVKSGADVDELLEMSDENIAKVKEDAAETDLDVIIRFIRIFSELENNLRYSTNKRIDIEVALIKLCKPQMEQNKDDVAERVSRLEKEVEELPKNAVVTQVYAAPQEAAQKPVPKVALPKALSEDVKKIIANWKSIKRNFPAPGSTYLEKGVPVDEGKGTLAIYFDDEMSYGFMQKREADLKELVEKMLEKQVDIRIKKNDTGHPGKDVFPNLFEIINMPIEIEKTEE